MLHIETISLELNTVRTPEGVVSIEPLEAFLAVAKLVALPVVDFAITAQGRDNQIYLTWREPEGGDTSYSGMWQLPGGFICFGETEAQYLGRILHKELPVVTVSPYWVGWTGACFNNIGEKRGHLVHHLFQVEFPPYALPENDYAGFFPVDALPKELIPHHVEILHRWQYLPTVLRICKIDW